MKFITHIDSTINIDNLSIQILKEISEDIQDSENESYINSFHIHPFTEIFTCGEIPYKVETISGTITMNKYDVLIVPPNIPHFRCEPYSEIKDYVTFGLILNNNEEKNGTKNLSKLLILKDSTKTIKVENNKEFYNTAKEFLNNVGNNDHFSIKLLLVSKLFEIAESVDTFEEGLVNKPHEKHIDVIVNFEYILNRKYMQPLTPSVVADELFISERQLYRIIKKHYNNSFHTLLTEKRINAAVQLLENSDISAEDICYIVGFQNKVSFYREFKKKVGTTPHLYKKSKK